MNRRRIYRCLVLSAGVLGFWMICGSHVPAQGLLDKGPSFTLTLGDDLSNSKGQVAAGLQLLALLTVLTLAPAFLIMLTSFTRIIVVLGFILFSLAANSARPRWQRR